LIAENVLETLVLVFLSKKSQMKKRTLAIPSILEKFFRKILESNLAIAAIDKSRKDDDEKWTSLTTLYKA
jgi:hypothetical protein